MDFKPQSYSLKKELKAALDKKIQNINASIYRSRNNKKIKPVAPQETSITYNKIQNAIAKEYDPRWFVCEHCLANRALNKENDAKIEVIFSVPLKDAPYSINTVSCPECGYEVSAK